jgi:hypothetical protein
VRRKVLQLSFQLIKGGPESSALRLTMSKRVGVKFPKILPVWIDAHAQVQP